MIVHAAYIYVITKNHSLCKVC